MARSSRTTIGSLARQAGVSAGTLRHYHRLGLLRPTGTSAGGYRLYTDADRGRLDLIRALRALDLDLETIGRLLHGAVSVRQVAELHLRTLDLQARTLARRRAVLRVLLRGPHPTTDRLARLHVLSGFERLDREQFLSEQIDDRFRGTRETRWRDWIQQAAVIDLPDSPTEAQVEAWLELAEMVSDPGFLAEHRARASTGTDDSKRLEAGSPDNLIERVRPAAAAARAGIDPSSAAARPIVVRWVRAFARRQGRRDIRAFAEEVLGSINTEQARREQRFWELLGVLKPDVAQSPMSVAWPWLVAALTAWVSPVRGGKQKGR